MLDYNTDNGRQAAVKAFSIQYEFRVFNIKQIMGFLTLNILVECKFGTWSKFVLKSVSAHHKEVKASTTIDTTTG